MLVREEREKRNWTQSELAERVGVRRLWISEFEQGKTTAQIGLVFRTLKALGLSISVGAPARSGGGATVVNLAELVKGVPDEVIAYPGETLDEAIRRTMNDDDSDDGDGDGKKEGKENE